VVSNYNENIALGDSSSYGKKSVDIAAPGTRIKSSLPLSRAGFLTGTSQATPFVTGVAAMLKSINKNLSPAKIKEIIRSSAKVELTLKSYVLSGGRLDAKSAVNKVSGSIIIGKTAAN
jgi:subtilisin family serine protease